MLSTKNFGQQPMQLLSTWLLLTLASVALATPCQLPQTFMEAGNLDILDARYCNSGREKVLSTLTQTEI